MSPEIAQMLGNARDDDDVHRMVVRVGDSKPPEDRDAKLYGSDTGDHVAIARHALAHSDLRRAIYHLSIALADDPGQTESLSLLDHWIAVAGARALDYAPLDDDAYFPTLAACARLTQMGNQPDHKMQPIPYVNERYHAKVAVHAYILAAQNRLSEAVPLLLQLIEYKPEIPYVLWIPRWQDRSEFDEGLVPDRVAAIGASLLQRYPGTYLFSDSDRAHIAHYLPLLRAAFAAYPQHEAIGGMYASLLRKVGSFEESVRIARTLPPSYITSTALAMGEAALGNQEAYIETYRQMCAVNPNDAALHNDIGTAYLAQGKLDEALAAYEESARLEPADSFDLAFSSMAYLHYLAALRQHQPTEQALDTLRNLAKSSGSARRFLNITRTPYIGKLPSGEEAIINLLRTRDGHLSDWAASTGSPSLTISSTHVEAPSARLAFTRALHAVGVTAEITVEHAPQPDPRLPLDAVEFQVWTYNGMDPVPAVPPPHPDIASEVARLAEQPFALDLWHAPARALGQRLGADALMNMVGVMAHPPAAPDGWKEWDWIAAVQIASALTLAYIDTGWEGSRRRAALRSLMYGPMDWSGAAAVVAMAVLANQDMRIKLELDRTCLELWSLAPDDGPWTLERAIVFSLLYVGQTSDAAQAKVRAYFDRLRQGN